MKSDRETERVIVRERRRVRRRVFTIANISDFSVMIKTKGEGRRRERGKHRGRKIGSEKSSLRTLYKGYETNSVRFSVICIQEWFECFTLVNYLAHQK